MCLIPEVKFDLDGPRGLMAYIEKLLTERDHCVICVAEGAGQVIFLLQKDYVNGPHVLHRTACRAPAAIMCPALVAFLLCSFALYTLLRVSPHFAAKVLLLMNAAILQDIPVKQVLTDLRGNCMRDLLLLCRTSLQVTYRQT